MEGKKRVLLLRGGRRLRILRETGRYYLCEGTQFSKTNPAIIRVIDEDEPKPPKPTDKKRNNYTKEAGEGVK